MSQLNLIQCDRCKVQAPSDNAKRWNWFNMDLVREVLNLIQTPDLCAECCDGLAAKFNAFMKQQPEPAESKKPLSLDELEEQHIRRVLESCNNVKQQAAKILGIERSTLDRKLKGYAAKQEIHY